MYLKKKGIVFFINSNLIAQHLRNKRVNSEIKSSAFAFVLISIERVKLAGVFFYTHIDNELITQKVYLILLLWGLLMFANGISSSVAIKVNLIKLNLNLNNSSVDSALTGHIKIKNANPFKLLILLTNVYKCSRVFGSIKRLSLVTTIQILWPSGVVPVRFLLCSRFELVFLIVWVKTKTESGPYSVYGWTTEIRLARRHFVFLSFFLPPRCFTQDIWFGFVYLFNGISTLFND